MTKDQSFAIDLIRKNIGKIDVHQFPLFADKVQKPRNASLINALFARLEKESNPHVYLKAAEVLIAFTDKDINKRIIEVYGRNPSLKEGWGGEEFLNY